MRAGLHPLNLQSWFTGDHHLHAFSSGSSTTTGSSSSVLSDDDDDDDGDGLSLVSDETDDGD